MDRSSADVDDEEREGRTGGKEWFFFARFAGFAFQDDHAVVATPIGQLTPVPPRPQ